MLRCQFNGPFHIRAVADNDGAPGGVRYITSLPCIVWLSADEVARLNEDTQGSVVVLSEPETSTAAPEPREPYVAPAIGEKTDVATMSRAGLWSMAKAMGAKDAGVTYRTASEDDLRAFIAQAGE